MYALFGYKYQANVFLPNHHTIPTPFLSHDGQQPFLYLNAPGTLPGLLLWLSPMNVSASTNMIHFLHEVTSNPSFFMGHDLSIFRLILVGIIGLSVLRGCKPLNELFWNGIERLAAYHVFLHVAWQGALSLMIYLGLSLDRFFGTCCSSAYSFCVIWRRTDICL